MIPHPYLAAAFFAVLIIALVAFRPRRLSPCCRAGMEFRFGWDYRSDGLYCVVCDSFVV